MVESQDAGSVHRAPGDRTRRGGQVLPSKGPLNQRINQISRRIVDKALQIQRHCGSEQQPVVTSEYSVARLTGFHQECKRQGGQLWPGVWEEDDAPRCGRRRNPWPAAAARELGTGNRLAGHALLPLRHDGAELGVAVGRVYERCVFCSAAGAAGRRGVRPVGTFYVGRWADGSRDTEKPMSIGVVAGNVERTYQNDTVDSAIADAPQKLHGRIW